VGEEVEVFVCVLVFPPLFLDGAGGGVCRALRRGFGDEDEDEGAAASASAAASAAGNEEEDEEEDDDDGDDDDDEAAEEKQARVLEASSVVFHALVHELLLLRVTRTSERVKKDILKMRWCFSQKNLLLSSTWLLAS